MHAAPEHKVDREIVLEVAVHKNFEADAVHAAPEHKVVLEAAVQRKVEADTVHAATEHEVDREFVLEVAVQRKVEAETVQPAPEHKVDRVIVLVAAVHERFVADDARIVHAAQEHKEDREIVLEQFHTQLQQQGPSEEGFLNKFKKNTSARGGRREEGSPRLAPSGPSVDPNSRRPSSC